MKIKGVAKKEDVIKALKDGAFLHHNGLGQYAKCHLVWGKWDRWQTVRYTTYYNLISELKLSRQRDGSADICRMK